MNAEKLEHTFQTSQSLEVIAALLKRTCRQTVRLDVEAHNANVIPAYRIVCVYFETVEDRDRVRIALRQLADTSATLAPKKTASA